jgi:hypothetical protein
VENLAVGLKNGKNVADAMQAYLNNQTSGENEKTALSMALSFAGRDSELRAVLLQGFWIGIFYAKMHPEDIYVEEEKPRPLA